MVKSTPLFLEADVIHYGDGRRQALILPKLLEREGHKFSIPTPEQLQSHAILIKWADMESSGKLAQMTESQLQGQFISEVFGVALGYTVFSQNLDHWQVQEHLGLPRGQDADAAIGFFAKEGNQPPTAIIELKGPTINLDRRQGSGRTPVQQCWDYLNEVPQCPWGIVCNYVSFRLYHRENTPSYCELFTLQELREQKRFLEFWALFERGGLLPSILSQTPRALRLLQESRDRQRTVGDELYRTYHEHRQALISHLRGEPHNKPLETAIRIAQTLLDRIIFVAFCEDADLLPAKSIQSTYNFIAPFELGENPRWRNFQNLFRSIDQGNIRFRIPPFNGGLFAPFPELDALDLDDRWTDFFHDISTYDFRSEVNVDVLGRLFEQSISDLEAIRANLGQAEQAVKPLGRRKREGVYYTPRAVTEYIVAHTLGPCIDEAFVAIAASHGVDATNGPVEGKKKAWVASRREMLDWLQTLRVCDPACGSGAFLIAAFDYLEDKYRQLVRDLADQRSRPDEDFIAGLRDTILRQNIFGVDLSGEAVEIARLALWIRTAEYGRKLADLTENIQCGNSIVDDPQADPLAFDWHKRFPKVFAEGGFHCVISNPPYVKLQNFRKTSPKVAAYLINRYRSARTGNFDLYLPFIEHGLEILRPAGRMGFIAPSVWLYNEYGRGLRELVLEKKALEHFVDFKSHQVFQDATTYTALQFFVQGECRAIEVISAHDGKTEREPFRVEYTNLSNRPWAFRDSTTTDLLSRMKQKSIDLGAATRQIFQGLITSADSIYHLVKLAPGRYYSHALPGEVDLEDGLMRPLISGEDAVPFAVPPTNKFVLFPYKVSPTESRLLSQEEMATSRRCWKYLCGFERELRSREGSKFNDDQWYRFGRTQSIDKQELPKLGLPQTVDHLIAFHDPRGERYFNNVRVNGILERIDGQFGLWFLLGILNSHATDYFFRNTAKPKDRGYFEANKQFIAPLPIPNVKPRQQKAVADIAEKLAKFHGLRLEAFAKVRRRIVVDLTPKTLLAESSLPPNLPRKLENFTALPIEDLLAAMGKFAGRKLRADERGDWDHFLTGECSAIAKITRRIDDLTAELNERVYTLFGLSSDDIKIIEDSLQTK